MSKRYCYYTAPVLAAPDFSKSFKLEVDASLVSARTVLLQEIDGWNHPVCYFFRKLDVSEEISYYRKREVLALLMALQYFDVYVRKLLWIYAVFKQNV